MSAYGNYTTSGGGRGGGSPYTSNLVDPYARNLSNHFEYIDADHGILQDTHRPSVAKGHSDIDDPDAPDVIRVRYMATLLPVEFPPYSISEGKAFVSQLRNAVAQWLQTDPRRVRLVYKKRDLKHDSWPLRKYDLKQNSEVAAIKTESVLDYSDRESHSSSGEDNVAPSNQNPRRRPRALSSIRHRSNDQIPSPRTPTTSQFLSPNGHIPSGTASERQSRGSLRPESDDRSYRREPSRTRGTSPHPTPSSTPAPSIRTADPNTPLGKLQTLSDVFHEDWLPLCRRFVSNPPSDLAAREKEHRKLSESVMQHVILKADAIDVDDSETRAFRKKLVNEVYETMKSIDAVTKR
ncbi:hypothetical protein A1O3_02097 [Capronia epimyces CBS 606.96]|uniref:BAG domain-containing protein n=1 Tax=Capronia epimyces CBS 606.96 TaxID=1182542 RepID=W9Y920_9EURO|nr:uncharacterized protein A1O3_02097 [Capronia epimyces CBS 606.96]EXJ89033.1 hypothetical protein A1O3_02097 [Capronia epimyces CBS 606.96]